MLIINALSLVMNDENNGNKLCRYDYEVEKHT